MEQTVDSRGMLVPMGGTAQATPVAEREIVERARGGDRSAFDRLVEAHLPRVWRVVWRVLRHHEDTEDVVQEVFLTAFRSLPEYRGDASLSTWLHRIAVTRALNHLDRSSEKVRRASGPLEDTSETPHHPEARAVADTPRDPGPSPLQTLQANELRRRLSECLSRLPAAWRAVIALRDGEELSYEEISGALALNVGTVRSRLSRARIALRQCIESQRP